MVVAFAIIITAMICLLPNSSSPYVFKSVIRRPRAIRDRFPFRCSSSPSSSWFDASGSNIGELLSEGPNKIDHDNNDDDDGGGDDGADVATKKHFAFTPNRPPLSKHILRDKIVLHFRDDLHTLPGPYLKGNKSRKFKGLMELLSEQGDIDCIVSHGGAQSNAMVALAAIGSYTNTEIMYYSKKPGRWLRNNPSGNYLRATSLGINFSWLTESEYADLFPHQPMLDPPLDPVGGKKCLWVPQGGAMPLSESGCNDLALDIYRSLPDDAPIAVVIPAGTGTTALFVHLHLQSLCAKLGPKDVKVFAVSCSSTKAYLHSQMSTLLSSLKSHDSSSQNAEPLPTLLDPYVAFGAVSKPVLNSWREAKDAGIYVDLVYGAVAIKTVFDCWDREDNDLKGRMVMLVNTGGLEGVASMWNRYKHKGWVEDFELE